MNKWIKVDSVFLNDALIHAMLSSCGECVGRVPSSWCNTKVHAFTQIDERHMKISWESKSTFDEVETGMCVVDSYFWED